MPAYSTLVTTPTATINLFAGSEAARTIATLSGPSAARLVRVVVTYTGATAPAAGALHTLTTKAALALPSAAMGDGGTYAVSTPTAPVNPGYVTFDEILVPQLDSGGTFTFILSSDNASDTAVHVGCVVYDVTPMTAGDDLSLALRNSASALPPRTPSSTAVGWYSGIGGNQYLLINTTGYDATATNQNYSVAHSALSALGDGYHTGIICFGTAAAAAATDRPHGLVLLHKASSTIVSRVLGSADVASIAAAIPALDAAAVRTAIGLASANLDTQLADLPTAAENADAVWDEARTGHTTAGTFGLYLDSQVSLAGGGASASAIADAVWDEPRSGHATAGTFGEGVLVSNLTAVGEAVVNSFTDDAAGTADPTEWASGSLAKTLRDPAASVDGKLTTTRAGKLDTLPASGTVATSADVSSGGAVAGKAVPESRRIKLRRVDGSGLVASATDRITIRTGEAAVFCSFDFSADVPDGAYLVSVTSVTSTAGITLTAVGPAYSEAKFTAAAGSAGTYTVTATVVYSDGTTAVGTGTIVAIQGAL